MRLQKESASIQHGASNLLQAAARVLNGVWKRVLMRRANRSLQRPDATADPFPPAVRQALEHYRRRARERAAAGHLSLEGIAAVVDEPLVPAGSEAEEHLSQCEECRREYDALRQLVTTVSKLPAVARPELTEGFDEFTLAGQLFGAAPHGKLARTTGSAALEERDLIELAKQQDDQACRILYELHSQYLYKVIRQLVGDDDLAEELSQDSWRRIFDKLALFESRSSFRTWATKVAQRVVQNRKRSPPMEPLEEWLVPGNGDEPLDRSTLEEEIARALARIPQIQRAVLLLHDRFGLSHIEIAVALGIDPGTSRSNLHKARARLRKELGGVDPREVG